MGNTFNFLAFLERQKAFSQKAFGPAGRAVGILNHVKKEIREIEKDPQDAMEWVDVTLLCLDRMWRMGYTPTEIAGFLEAKLSKNEGRTWPDWQTMSESDAIEHDRTGEITSMGAALISAERMEQIQKHKFDNARDSKFYWRDELRQAAMYCLTLDDKLYPKSWDNWFRLKIMAKRARMTILEFHTEMNKIAGALLAADIDRINSDDLKVCTFIAERGNAGQGAAFVWKVDLAGIVMPASVPVRANFEGPAVGVAYPVLVEDGVQITAIMPKELIGWPAAGFSVDDDFATDKDGVKVYGVSRLQEISICGTPNADVTIQPIN